MFNESHAEVYEVIYKSGRGKDYQDEARLVEKHVRELKPDARSLLDVACGTGAHLGPFNEMFSHTEGIDLSEAMLTLARKELDSSIPLHHGDMRDFDLGRKFDAVVCMFASISYAGDLDGLVAAIRTMADHLVPGGVLVIEPWWFSENFIEGYVNGDVTRRDGRVLTRISHSVREDGHTKMELRFVIADASGIRDFTEIERLALWTKEEYVAAFEKAGIPAEYHPGQPAGRGLFVAVKK